MQAATARRFRPLLFLSLLPTKPCPVSSGPNQLAGFDPGPGRINPQLDCGSSWTAAVAGDAYGIWVVNHSMLDGRPVTNRTGSWHRVAAAPRTLCPLAFAANQGWYNACLPMARKTNGFMRMRGRPPILMTKKIYDGMWAAHDTQACSLHFLSGLVSVVVTFTLADNFATLLLPVPTILSAFVIYFSTHHPWTGATLFTVPQMRRLSRSR